MPDEQKSEEAALGGVQELEFLRRRVCELEQEIAVRKLPEQEIANLAKLPAEDPNPVLRISKDCTILYANDASSIVLQTWQRHVGQALPEPCCQRAKEAISRGEVSTFEFTCVDGRIFLVTLAPVAQEGYLNAYGVDITERKNAESSLKENEAKYRDLVEGLTDVIFTTDAEGTVTSVNKAEKGVFGRDATEIVGSHFTGSLVPEYVPEAIAGFKRVLAGESITVETVALHKNGKPLNIELSATPVIRDGIVAGTRGIIRDITERKKAEKELKEGEATLRSIIDSVTESILLMEPEGTVLVANRAVAERLGTTIDGLTGKCVYDFLSADVSEQRRGQAEKAVRTGEPVIFEDMQGERHILNSVNPVKDSTGKVVRIAVFGLDVTHMVEMQEALRESELRYRSLFESSPVGLGLSTTDGKILDCNSTMLGMIGYSIAEIGQVNLKDTYVNPQARARLLKELATNGLVRDFQVHLRRRDGTAYWASLSVIPFPFGGQNTMLAAQVDITAQRQMQQALITRDKAIASSINAIAIADPKGNLTYVNDSFLKMWGYGDDKQVLGKHAATFWQHQDGPMQAIEVLHKTGGWIGELTAVKPDGSTFDAQVSASIVRGDNGDPICMMASFVDVSERKRAAESLRQSENKYRTLLENLPQRIFLKDNNSVYISCNANYARDLKIKPAEIAGKTDYDFYPKELAEKYKADDRRVVESGQTIDIEEKYILEGREFIVHTVKTPVADEQGNVIGMLGIFWDITDSKRRERELNLYREKMTQAERMASLGTLSASVAHELTQPLTTIRLSIENSLVDLEGTSCPPDALEELKDGIEGVEYAVSIIDRFRHFARQSSDEAITEVELKEVAERIVRLLDKNAQQADISLQLKDLERLPPIYANEKDMEQLFFAIVDNAIHAASGKEKRQLTISGVVKGEHIELRFADNCGGIAPENVDKIFEPFFTTRPAGEGTGLGLPIVRHIVSRVGGKVWVQNYPGKGATFLVNLPIGKDMGS